MSQTQQASPYDVLKIKDFRRFLLARTSLTFGINILTRVVQLQMVYDIFKNTQSPEKTAYALGLIGMAEFIPFLLIVFVGGWVADHFDRRSILIWSVLAYSLCAFSLYGLSAPFSYVLDNQNVTPLYFVIGLTGLVRGFLSPTQSAFSAQLVPPNLYANATTWTTTSWHLTAVTGPAVGGFIFSYGGGAAMAYALVIALSVLCFFLFLTIPSRFDKNEMGKKGDTKPPFFQNLNEGIKFVFNNQYILGSIALDMFAVLFGGAVVLIPVFAKEILHVGAQEAALLQAAPAIGALVTAIVLARYPPIKNAGKLLLYSVAAFGLCTVLFAVSENFWFSFLMLAGTGFFDNVSMVIRGTILQLFTPDEMRGRVSAVNSLFIGSSNELGAFESGLAARYMGLTPSVIFGGFMTVLIVGFTWWKTPKLRNLDL
jgi:MFS family permease